MTHAALPEGFAEAVAGAGGAPVAVATVTAVIGSAPVPVGEQMLVAGAGVAVGSVSNGCIDADVYLAALDVLADGGDVLRRYGPDGSPLASVLTCGGVVEIAVERFPTHSGVLATLDAIAARAGHPAAPPRLYLVGATTVAARLARIAGPLGYSTVVIDPRPVFADPARVPGADAVVRAWPDRELRSAALGPADAVVVLTHDDRFDVAVLRHALAGGAGFVGALGSRRTADRLRAALLTEGVPEETVARLRSPVGVPIGSVGPAEIAVSIAAELIAVRRAVVDPTRPRSSQMEMSPCTHVHAEPVRRGGTVGL
ncbi:XdhC family protein [Tsukamurella soli]|uniref:Xanthine dehydrogenase accessory factor n=1 Tax=Tsukamurella soli TaxID=644556 RepID=A0ABP8KET7_9ACTN